MALNFTVSYTFSPSTTISSSQVNTNTSDVAAVFQGLEAETKTLAKLKVDIDPTLALEVATKQYVDHYSTYRRPNLQQNSSTVVNVETGLDGTSGDCTILFPDGNLRTDTVAGRIQCNLAQVAALSGSWQSGLRTGSVANNTWYAIYAVKTTDNASHWVAVADTVLPLQANFSTLNSNFGASGWVYLGMIRNGDNGSTATGILSFKQSGHVTKFTNVATGFNAFVGNGILFATVLSAATLTYTYSAGTGAAAIPNHLLLMYVTGAAGGGSTVTQILNSGGTINYWLTGGATGVLTPPILIDTTGGAKVTNGSSVPMDIYFNGFIDPVLGVGSNPIL